jgi:hypothetical protein
VSHLVGKEKRNTMEELRTLYKELQERQKLLESRKKTTINEGRIRENVLTIIRVQQLLLPLVMSSLPSECVENWQSNYYCSLSGKCKKCEK